MTTGFEYVFQNYIYVPIISAIIGAILSMLVPKLFIWCGKKIKKIANKSVDTIDISGDWNSFFHEGDIIQSESIILEQEGQTVNGEIVLENRRYLLNGEFKNQILMGTYISKNTRKDERGAIVLRRINENLLSGFCTFVYKDKQVYSSPYILTSTSYHNVKKGTYSFCNSCIGKFDCCCNCNKIDMPIILPSEAQEIETISRKSINDFAIKLTSNLYQMRRFDNQEKNGCIFFVNNQCSIYNNRPIDCRLFPFDFKEINGEYWLIYYNSIDICRALPTDINEIKNYAHNIRPLLDMLLPYMSECSNPIFSKRLENQQYIKLFTIRSLKEDITNEI
ncbi:MAG: YkgJ family cysteine cluster protein [Lachnospiraceae bacterium]|nr:YkgJ family cysteine cluster protein [Lachnospiraceae bacterium]